MSRSRISPFYLHGWCPNVDFGQSKDKVLQDISLINPLTSGKYSIYPPYINSERSQDPPLIPNDNED